MTRCHLGALAIGVAVMLPGSAGAELALTCGVPGADPNNCISNKVSTALEDVTSETLFREHPDWTFAQVNAEIEKINGILARNEYHQLSHWGKIVAAFADAGDIVNPFTVGKRFCKWMGNGFCDFAGGGSFGGGGANGMDIGEWGQGKADRAADLTGQIDCGDVNYSLDVDGNLIIPAMPMPSGGPVNDFSTAAVSGVAAVHTGTTYFGVPSDTPKTGMPTAQGAIMATSGEAAMKRFLHLVNMKRPKNQWYGAVKYPTPGFEVLAASVSSRNPDGTIYHRETLGSHVSYEQPIFDDNGSSVKCPQNASGGTFDFYVGFNGSRSLQCYMYAPNPSLGFQGYALSEKTTIPAFDLVNWPNNLPDILKACPLDKEFLRKMTEVLMKKACAANGNTGALCTAAPTVDDVRSVPQVGDLGTPKQDLPGTNQTGPTPKPTATPTPTSTATPTPVDLGPNPNTPAPTVEAPSASSIMDPVLNWFPSIKTIQVNVGSATCPTWQAEPFGWHLVMDSHCAFIEQYRSIISTIMIVGFTLGAATIILRA